MLFADITAEQVAAYLSLITAGGTAVAWAARKFHRLIKNQLVLAQRVETMWRWHLSRGTAEAILKGHAMKPLTYDPGKVRLLLTPKTRQLFEPIASELQCWYRENGQAMTREQMAESIEKEYQHWLVENICLPLGVHEGACIALAIEVACERAEEESSLAETMGPFSKKRDSDVPHRTKA